MDDELRQPDERVVAVCEAILKVITGLMFSGAIIGAAYIW